MDLLLEQWPTPAQQRQTNEGIDMLTAGLFTVACGVGTWALAQTMPISENSAITLSMAMAAAGGIFWFGASQATLKTEVRDLKEHVKVGFKDVKQQIASLPCPGRKMCKEEDDSRT